MKFDIITIFPKIFDSYFNESIIWRAQKSGKIKINKVDLRKFSADKNKKVDDRPYGGGPGMVFKIEPIIKAILNLKPNGIKEKMILFSATGKQFNSKTASEWAKKYNRIIMIAGHYEGVDERIKKIVKIEEISIGPYTLTGGELPAMVVIDAVSRHIPGVLGKKESLEEKRLGIGVPVYTRPEVFEWPPPGRGKRGKKYAVPKVLLSGDHKKIEEWRNKHQKKNL
ncbi:MAG: tRNA (guanosine(37)-N1)-methyltransferase TrmD [Candidatus Azambacteria bacterium]|nr:tRNA (guanosine(37)-N1)-methyltransferase TrmD [Candidatus Azambacteria bacterium]